MSKNRLLKYIMLSLLIALFFTIRVNASEEVSVYVEGGAYEEGGTIFAGNSGVAVCEYNFEQEISYGRLTAQKAGCTVAEKSFAGKSGTEKITLTGDGLYTIKTEIISETGEEYIKEKQVYLDGTMPTVESVCSAAGIEMLGDGENGLVFSKSVTLKIKAYDEGTGLKKIVYYLNQGAAESENILDVTVGSDGYAEGSLVIEGPFDGTIYFKGIDRVGNESPYVSLRGFKIEAEDKAQNDKMAEENTENEESQSAEDEEKQVEYTDDQKEAVESQIVEQVETVMPEKIAVKNDTEHNKENEKGDSRSVRDNNKPKINIYGVVEGGNYQELINILVKITDRNLCSEKIYLQDNLGGEIEFEKCGERSGTAYYRLADKIKAKDGVYILYAEAVDSYDNKTVSQTRFIVNSKGSSFHVITDEYLDKYNSAIGDIIVEEKNLSPIIPESSKLKIMFNGLEKMLEAKKDFDVEIGVDDSSVKYLYRIDHKYFEQDGKYDLYFYSEDEAGNQNCSFTGEEASVIQFGRDGTFPEIVGINISEKAVVDSSEYTAAISVTDNLELDKVKISLNDINVDYIERDGVYYIKIPEAREYQSLQITATDKAGNVTEKRFDYILVNSDRILRLLYNQRLFLLLIMALLVVVGAGTIYITKLQAKGD